MTTGDLLGIAIQHEVKSQILYTHLATVVAADEVKNVFLELVLEERAHERRLYELSASGRFDLTLPIDAPEFSNEISRSHSVYVTIDENASATDVVDLAVGREKRAQQLFHRLASFSGEGPIRALFLQLAAEEEEHERRILEKFAPLLKGNPD